MTILVLGATGMAGHMITLYLKEKGHDVTAFSRTGCDYARNIIGDAKDLELIKDIVKDNQYDAIVNAIGILNKSAEDNKADAVFLNSYLPHYLVKITEELKTRVIHLSTDCVFSGLRGKYKEHDIKDGESFYDRSKALGEVEDSKNLTFRNSIIGPDINQNGMGLFNWYMKQQGTINGYSKAIWSGVTTLELAKAINRALEDNLVGLYQLVNNENISKYSLLKLFNEVMDNKELNIVSSEGVVVNKSLYNTRDDFDFEVASYREMIEEQKQWIFGHKKIYPHYFN